MHTPMTERYIQTRYAPSLLWFERRAEWNRTRHRAVQGALLSLSVLTPMLALTSWRGLTVLAASAVAILIGFSRLYQFEPLSQRCRSTAEAMTHERWLFETGSGPYTAAQQPDLLFVERIEAIITEAHSR